MTTLSVRTYEELNGIKLESKVWSQISEISVTIFKLALLNYGMPSEDVNKLPNHAIATICSAYRMTDALTNDSKRNWAEVDIYRTTDLDNVNKVSPLEVDCKRFLNDDLFELIKSFTVFVEVFNNADKKCESLRLKSGIVNHLNILTKEL